MTDRDRLIELFNAIEKDPAVTCPHYKTDKTCDTCKYTINNFMCNHKERTVDYLLANGVIVPPCKVGDILYVISSNKQILPFVVNRIIITNYIKIKVDYIAGRDYEIKYLLPDYFGKTVFLTKEEAEEKLKELKENA